MSFLCFAAFALKVMVLELEWFMLDETCLLVTPPPARLRSQVKMFQPLGKYHPHSLLVTPRPPRVARRQGLTWPLLPNVFVYCHRNCYTSAQPCQAHRPVTSCFPCTGELNSETFPSISIQSHWMRQNCAPEFASCANSFSLPIHTGRRGMRSWTGSAPFPIQAKQSRSQLVRAISVTVLIFLCLYELITFLGRTRRSRGVVYVSLWRDPKLDITLSRDSIT